MSEEELENTQPPATAEDTTVAGTDDWAEALGDQGADPAPPQGRGARF